MLADGGRSDVRVIGGRYGLGSKEFTPAMVKAVFDELRRRAAQAPLHGRHRRRRHRPQPRRRRRLPDVDTRHRSAVFYGLGSDGTVGANKASVKIIGERAGPVRPGLLRLRLEEVGVDDRVAPALRARPDPLHLPRRRRPISSPATSSACSTGSTCSSSAKPGATFLLNAPYPADEVWEHLPGGDPAARSSSASCGSSSIDAARDRPRGWACPGGSTRSCSRASSRSPT